MRELRRLAVLAAALTATGAAGLATAQTVVVTKAPPGATVELGLNTATIGTATADAAGIATLPVNLESRGRKPEADTRVLVDVCETARRVTLLEAGWEAPPPAAGCTRHEIFGVFYLQKITTVVVSAGDQAQAVWIKQGSAPAAWLRDRPVDAAADARPEVEVPSGLVIFAGAGLSKYKNASTVACGPSTTCSSDDNQIAGWFGGDYWIRPFLAASFGYVKPAGAKASGEGTGYRFNTSLDPNVVTMAGKVAIPYRRFRAYGEVGASYNWTTSLTNQTMDEVTLDVDGLIVIVPGGTQSFTLKTDGWSWTWGGGVEFWFSKSVGIWGEYSWVGLKGKASGGGEGTLDDSLTSVFAGVRFRLGKS
jgi:opacity protein-like surface antigen